ncbi:MAG TPA: ribonuclease P protein component [Gammaproteobacteria bacterium]|nr:ribonuclease P protein component [Gammaproteobacteria bacterium]
MIIAGSQEFTRKYRLVTAADYRRVFARAKKLNNRCLTVLIRENDKGYPRLGLAISRKNTKNAVQRNTVKRLIREAFRRNRQALGSCDLVFLARPALSARSRRELVRAVDEIYKKLSDAKSTDVSHSGLPPGNQPVSG